MQGVKRFMMKKLLLQMVSVVCILLMGGCWDKEEINDLAIITATAMDKSDDGQIELSVEIFIPKSMGGGAQGGGGGGGGEQQTTLVTSQKGTNIADALSKLQAETPRKLFWGSCRVFVFGEDLAKDGIHEQLDFLLRHPGPRESAFAFVSEGEAKKIIELKTSLERYSSEALREVVERGFGMVVNIQELDEMLSQKDQDPALPYLEIAKEKMEVGKTLQFADVNGIAVFKQDQMVGVVKEPATRGLLWLRDEMKEYTITIEPDNEKGTIGVTPVSVSTNLIPEFHNGKWKMVVEIQTTGTIVQNTTKLDMNHQKSLEKVEKAYREKIEERVTQALEEIQGMKADVVHYGLEFHRKYPKQWAKIKNRWDEVFPEVETEFKIQADIHRQGSINEPVKPASR